MKPIFVKEWHGIPLNSIKGFVKNKIPGEEFYSNFYEKFFEAHQTWDDLDPDWVDHKINSAKFIGSRLKGAKRVLSIGCGVGIIEKYLLEEGVKGLEIQEVSEEPLRWIRTLFATEAVHIGGVPDCLSLSGKYDYIFLSVVDYCFEEEAYVGFLSEIRDLLSSNGRCLVITPTIHFSKFEWAEIKFWMKFKLKTLISFPGFYDLGQLVGWRRDQNEFQNALISAGFKVSEKGFLGQDAMFSKTFWIEGVRD